MVSDANKIFKLYAESKQEPEMITLSDGTKQWRLNGVLHREDGPAIVSVNDVRWMQHGNYHREGAPAIVIRGDTFWYVHGKLHRLDGPAVEYQSGEKAWWVDNRMYSNITAWAKGALEFEHKDATQDAIDAKIAQVMQQDLFS